MIAIHQKARSRGRSAAAPAPCSDHAIRAAPACHSWTLLPRPLPSLTDNLPLPIPVVLIIVCFRFMLFYGIGTSQCGVVTCFEVWCRGGVAYYHFTGNLLQSLLVKELCKSVSIWQS